MHGNQKDPDVRSLGARTEVDLVTNGIRRTFLGKKFDKTFRVYRIHGDVTTELEEAFQELALKMHCERIEYRPSAKRS